MRATIRRCCAVLAVALFVAARPADGGAIIFSIAQEGDPWPGGKENWALFSPPATDGTFTVWTARGSSFASDGLFAHDGIDILDVVMTGDTIDSAGTVVQIWEGDFGPSVDHGQLGAAMLADNEVIIAADLKQTATPVKIAEGGPGTDYPGGLSPVNMNVVSPAKVAFRGWRELFGGFIPTSPAIDIFCFDGGVAGPCRVVESGTFTDFNLPSLAGPDLAYIQFSPGPSIIAVLDFLSACSPPGFCQDPEAAVPEGGSTTVTIAGTSTPIPGGSGNFTILFPPSMDNGRVAFVGNGNGGQTGVYLHDGTTLNVVADTNTALPDGPDSILSFAEAVSLDGENLAFLVSGLKGGLQFNAIYIARVPFAGGVAALDRMVSTEDDIDGQQIISLSMGREAVGKNLLVFKATAAVTGIYGIDMSPVLPDPVPGVGGPALALFAVLIATAGAMVSRRRMGV